MGATALNPAVPPRRGLVSARLLKVASDEKLVQLVRQGSQPAFEIVFDRHHRGILSFCRHMLANREEAEDAVQHTFMAAYKGLLGSDKDIQLRAWLYAIARNRCLSVLRARREQPSDDIELVSVEGLAAEVQRRDDLRELLQDLASLPEDQRAALVLSEIGDLGHDEIAGVLGCPKDKVKALVFQARSSLHQSRDARETSCEEIREMLSTLSGGSLRRTTLRRHVKSCAGCAAFEAEVKRQRRALAVVLPVVPTLGLKESALAAVFGQGAAAGGAAVAGGAAAAGTGVFAGGGASAVVAKVLVVATVAGGGAAGMSAVNDGGSSTPRSTPASGPGPNGAAPAPAATVQAAAEQEAKVEQDKPRRSRKGRRRGHTDRGKEFAKTRGKGEKKGLLGTQPGTTVSQEKRKAAAERVKKDRRAAQQKARAKGKAKAKAQRPARRQPAKPPKPEPTPRPTPEPKPTPQATPTPAPEPTPGKKS